MKLRWILVALIALVAIGGIFTSASQTQKTAGTSDCEARNRVTLVVDFGDNGPTLVRCAANFKGTGWQLFAATGTNVSGTDQYSEGFVCRIEGVPSENEQPCHSTPTYAQGGWAYFVKTAHSKTKWLFSPTGSALRKPECGSIDGWRFFKANENPAVTEPRTKLEPFKC